MASMKQSLQEQRAKADAAHVERLASIERKHKLEQTRIAAKLANNLVRECVAEKHYAGALVEARNLVAALEILADEQAKELQTKFANVTGLPVKAASK